MDTQIVINKCSHCLPKGARNSNFHQQMNGKENVVDAKNRIFSIKRNEILIHATMCIKSENILLCSNKARQT